MIIEGPIAQFGRRVSNLTNFIARSIAANVFELRRGTIEEPGDLLLGFDAQGRMECPGKLVLGTAQATTSGTYKDFTGIPVWVKRITLNFSGVSTNGSAYPRIQLLVGGVPEAGGYIAASMINSATNVNSIPSSTGFDIYSNTASASLHGSIVLTRVDANTWSIGGGVSYSATTMMLFGGKTLAGPLDGIRLTTANGTDVFDAGLVNILYE